MAASMRLAHSCAHAPVQRVQLRAAPFIAAVPLRRARLPTSRGGTTVAARSAFWRRLADGARVGDRELRLKQAGTWESKQLSAAAAEHLTERGAVEEHTPAHRLDKATLTGVDNEPPPHHHNVPTMPSRRVAPPLAFDLPPFPPPVRVKVPMVPRMPAGILVATVRAPSAPFTLEGPVAIGGVGVTAALLLAFAIVALGRLAARRRGSRSPEQPLFRPPRYPRWWWLP